MLKLTTIEFFLRLIPEMMIFMWGIYVVSREKFKLKNYIFATFILGIITFGVRELPIHYGVHTIINNVLTVCILIIIGIPIVKGIYSTLVVTLLLSLSEIFNMLVLKVFNINSEKLFRNIIVKCILGFPSLIFFAVFILLIMLYLKRRKDISDVSNRKISY